MRCLLMHMIIKNWSYYITIFVYFVVLVSVTQAPNYVLLVTKNIGKIFVPLIK